MPPAMLNLGGRKFVVIPEGEYRQLKAKAARNGKPTARRRLTVQEKGDIAIVFGTGLGSKRGCQ